MEDRTCKHCDGQMPAGYPKRLYCTVRCRERAKWDRAQRIPCVVCGGPSGWRIGQHERAKDAGPTCRKCSKCSKPIDDKPEFCAHCTEPFESCRRRDTWTRFCSKSCARKSQLADGSHPWMKSSDWRPALTDDERKARRFRQGELARRKRRARLAEVESEPYSLAEIAERDGFRCGICGRKVDMNLKYPHPRSASVDHIIPLSHPDGTDMRVNVRLAHLGENAARGNRAGWEQQLLIG